MPETYRQRRATQRAAVDAWIAGGRRGPRPPPLYATGGRERAKVEAEAAPPTPPPADPLARDDARRAEKRVADERDKLLELLREERARNAFVGALRADPAAPRIVASERASGLREMTAVVVASDWHVEEDVPAVKAGGRNEYNLEIAAASIDRFFRAQIDLVRHHRASRHVVIRDMVCAFIGDLITGHIHEELAEVAALAPMDAARWLKPRVVGGLRSLLDALDLRSLVVPWCYGNHGRSTPKSRIATGAEHSFEYWLGCIVRDELADDPRVRFALTPTPYQYVEAYGFTLGFHHGDSIGYGGGIGGIGIPLLKALNGWDSVRYAHVWHIGHFHQLRDYGRAMVNGSMIGYGPYSQWIRAPFEEPKQLFYLLDSKRGKCHVTSLWVRDGGES